MTDKLPIELDPMRTDTFLQAGNTCVFELQVIDGRSTYMLTWTNMNDHCVIILESNKAVFLAWSQIFKERNNSYQNMELSTLIGAGSLFLEYQNHASHIV